MWRRWVLIGLLPAMLLASGCQANAGGWIPSNDGISKATFGFVFDALSNTFSGTYKDPNGQTPLGTLDVDIFGTGVVRTGPPGQFQAVLCTGSTVFGTTPYQVNSGAFKGATGTLDLFLCDLDGNGKANEGDFLSITVTSGPYTGYRNAGFVQGNISLN